MSKEACFKVNNPHVINETIEGESVIINLVTGFYYSLDNVGAEIWDALAAKTPVDNIVSILTSRYEGSKEDIENSVDHLITQLRKENLIVPASPGDAKKTDDPEKPARQKSKFARPALNKFGDMQDLLLLDPIHEVDEQGWPHGKEENDPPKK